MREELLASLQPIPEGKVVLVIGPASTNGLNQVKSLVSDLNRGRKEWIRCEFGDNNLRRSTITDKVALILTLHSTRHSVIDNARTQSKVLNIRFVPHHLNVGEIKKVLQRLGELRGIHTVPMLCLKVAALVTGDQIVSDNEDILYGSSEDGRDKDDSPFEDPDIQQDFLSLENPEDTEDRLLQGLTNFEDARKQFEALVLNDIPQILQERKILREKVSELEAQVQEMEPHVARSIECQQNLEKLQGEVPQLTEENKKLRTENEQLQKIVALVKTTIQEAPAQR